MTADAASPAARREIGAAAQQLSRERRPLQQPCPAVKRRRAQQRLQQLAGDAEGEVPLQLAAAGRENGEPPLHGQRPRRAQEARLPRTRDALDDDEPAHPGGRRVEGPRDGRQLGLALEEPVRRGYGGRRLGHGYLRDTPGCHPVAKRGRLRRH